MAAPKKSPAKKAQEKRARKPAARVRKAVELPEEKKPAPRRARKGSVVAAPQRPEEREEVQDVGGEALRPLSAKHAAFVAAIVAHGGNVSAGARAVGYEESYGRALVSQNATIKAALAATKATDQEELNDWRRLAQKAKRRLDELMDSPEDPVALQAVKLALERGLGKVPLQVEQTTTVVEQAPTDRDLLRKAVMLAAARGWSLFQAMSYVKSQSETIELVPLPPGDGPILDAEIVEE